MAINWELGVMPDIVGNALAAFDEGQTRRAYSSLAENPNDPKARATLYRNDPRGAAMWERQQAEAQARQQEAQAKAREQQAAVVKQTAAILRQVKADPSKYPMARQAAIQLGIPAASIPEQYDPQWVGQQDMIYSAFEKDGGQSLTTLAQNVMMTLPPEQRDPNSPVFVEAFNKAFIAEQTKTIPYTQGGGVAGYNPYTGQTNTIIAPNPGDKPTGAPVGAGPKPGAVVGGFRFKGGNPNDRSSWEPATGGASGNAGGNFRPVGIPGERVTSTRRSPAHNKAVGGVTNSYHLSGLARDSVPPAGMTMAAYASELRRLNPGLDVINEGDHVHMEPR